jgi:uncharacterized membrane protein YukC
MKQSEIKNLSAAELQEQLSQLKKTYTNQTNQTNQTNHIIKRKKYGWFGWFSRDLGYPTKRSDKVLKVLSKLRTGR